MNQLRAESIPEDVIAGASALVLTSYLVRCKPGEPMPEATMKAIEYAKKYNVPVVLTLHQVCHCRESAVVAAIPQRPRLYPCDERR